MLLAEACARATKPIPAFSSGWVAAKKGCGKLVPLAFAALTSTPSASGSLSSLARGFLDLDERVASGAPGLVLVRAPEGGVRAIVEHLARRVQQGGFVACVCNGGRGAPAFHIAARTLRANKAFDPQTLAEELLSAAMRKRSVLLAQLPDEGTWDRTVVAEIAASPRAALVILVTDREDSLPGAEVFEVPSSLDEAERHRFLSAAVEHEVRHSGLHALHDLSTFAARLSGPKRLAPRSEQASALLANLGLVGMPWPESRATLLTDPDHTADVTALVDELCTAGLVARRDGHLSILQTSELPAGDSALAAEALLALHAGDGWAEGRAAELLLASNACPSRADALHARALDHLTDPLAKQELRRRWIYLARNEHDLLLRASHRALEADEPEEALRCAQSSASRGASGSSSQAELSLLMGRALMGLGDLVGAKVAFDAARSEETEALKPAIAVELAELCYARGAFEDALSEADVARGGDPKTALRASNLIGKIRLAEGNWDVADAHFANDAMVANAAGLVREALRARLNRAIAVLSKGLLDEANAMLRAVLDDAQIADDQRACAHALTNLAVVAWTRHDYGSALDCLERTFARRRALGSPATIRHTVASLAELRLRLGLYDHASHTITFGRRGTMSPADASQFAVVASRIALAKGDSLTARREIEAAIADAASSSDQEWMAEAHRVAARISLDEGDVAACRLHLDKAAGTTDRSRAEHSLIDALASRAAGTVDVDAAHRALRLARAAGDEEILCEILYLLALIHRDQADLTSARGFCEQASSIRARVADGLRADVRGAFLAKPESLALNRLQASLADTDLEQDAPRTERSPRERLPEASRRDIVGEDPAIRSLIASIKKVARSSATVLIRGESGTGKELVADALHRASDRASGPLVSVNCAALVENLLLSELFGHEKGAFTGAGSRRRGRFEMAEGGTLFLDEIGDISPRTQVALLRVLQEKTFERVGGTTPVRANVRVVCATHRDLRAMVERGEFREDLYYRLRGIQLEVPALRARLGDVGRIAESLLTRIAQERSEPTKRLSSDAIDLLRSHKWPGNIRELENALRAASLFTEGDVIDVHELVDNVEDLRLAAQAVPAPLSLRSSVLPVPSAANSAPSSVDSFASLASIPGAGEDDEAAPLPTDEANATAIAYEQVRQGSVSLSDMKRQIERDCIARALADTKGNITKAAALLGMKRPRLSQLVKQYGLTATSTEGL